MAAPPTDWRSRVTPLDARGDDGQVLVVPWLFDSDDAVAIDLSDQLDAGESLTNPTRSLAKLRAHGEATDTLAPEALVGQAAISGTIVMQRLTGLVRGRWYRLEVLHGAAGNRRGASLLIHCPE